MSATADRLVATPSDTVTYVARRELLRLTLRARYPEIDPVTRRMVGWRQTGIYAGFRDGVLTIPPGVDHTDINGDTHPNQVLLADTLDGGEAWVDRDWLIGTLETHRLNGDPQEGFQRVSTEAPAPSDDEYGAIVDAVVALDADTLGRIIKEEAEGYRREKLIARASDALEKVNAVLEGAASEGE
jgi:hypothetical protein